MPVRAKSIPAAHLAAMITPPRIRALRSELSYLLPAPFSIHMTTACNRWNLTDAPSFRHYISKFLTFIAPGPCELEPWAPVLDQPGRSYSAKLSARHPHKIALLQFFLYNLHYKDQEPQSNLRPAEGPDRSGMIKRKAATNI